MKLKVLILGAGNAQYDILEYLNSLRSVEVYSLSNRYSKRCAKYIDHFELIDISDKSEVFNYAKKNKIDFIYSVGSDVAMPTVAWVSKQLGQKAFVDYNVAGLCGNKHLLREFLEDEYGAVPFKVLDEKLSIGELSYPIIVKPSDSQGQRGITRVDEEKGLLHAYNNALKFTRCGAVIAEEEIDGPEVSVNVYMLDGQIAFYLPSDRISWSELEGGIIKKHVIPSRINENALLNVKILVTNVVEKLGIRNGPVYFQIKLRENQPFLIEVTPRLDGCHLWRLIYESTGVNLLATVVRHLLGSKVLFPNEFKAQPGILEFVCQAPGTKYNSLITYKNNAYLELYYEPGDLVLPINGKMEKCGYYIYME